MSKLFWKSRKKRSKGAAPGTLARWHGTLARPERWHCPWNFFCRFLFMSIDRNIYYFYPPHNSFTSMPANSRIFMFIKISQKKRNFLCLKIYITSTTKAHKSTLPFSKAHFICDLDPSEVRCQFKRSAALLCERWLLMTNW